MKDRLFQKVLVAGLACAPLLGVAQSNLVERVSSAGSSEVVSPKSEKKPSPSFAGLFSTTFANGYIPSAGFSIGGPVNQNFLSLGFNDVALAKDNLSVFTWNNTDFSRNFEATEHDVGVNYTFSPLTNLTVTLSGQCWRYPSRRLGSRDDWVTDCNVTWNGPLTLGVQGRHLWEHTGIQSGNYAYVFASKSVPLGKVKGADVSLAFEGGATYLDRFYQPHSAWGVARGVATLNVTKGPWSVGFSGGHQWNLDGDVAAKPNTPLVSGTIGYSF